MRLNKSDIEVLLKIREILDSEIKPLPIETLAEQFNLTKARLQKRFRFLFHVPIRRYHLEKRMEYAKEELTKGTPVKELVITMQFVDHSHFNKAFQSVFHQPPSFYTQRGYENMDKFYT